MTPVPKSSSDRPEAGCLEPSAGLTVALELLELGKAMRRQRHRREFPGATEAEVDAVVHAWEIDRPGAPFGDAIGNPVSWPRKTSDGSQ
jgi:hypothetical protein